MKIKRFPAVVAALTMCVAGMWAGPRYVFYFIGDGMGLAPVNAAVTYQRMVTPQAPSMVMTTFPVAGWVKTYSASSPVTDSAAAGTALSTGHKTGNGMLGVTPDSAAVRSIASTLKDNGWGVGLVTTVGPDDATPGAFYAHVPKRSQYYDIDKQFIDTGYEFLAGSSLRGVTDKDGNATDVLPAMEEAGIQIVYGKDGMDSAAARRVIWLGDPEVNLNGNDVGYTIDSVADALTLQDMTAAAIDHLMKVSPDRFFIMAEGGNIDHALHANDGGAAIKEIINFDKAIAVAYEFYKQHPDETLIVVSADHDTGGMSVGNRTVGYNCYPHMIDAQKVSKEAFTKYTRRMLKSRANWSWDDLRDYLQANLGFWTVVPVTEDETLELKQAFDDAISGNSKDEKSLYASFDGLTTKVFKMFNDKAGFGFVTGSHTGNPVPVFAVGNGAGKFTQVNNNTQLPVKIMEIINE